QVTCSQTATFLHTVVGQHSYCGQATQCLRQTVFVAGAGAHGAAQVVGHGLHGSEQPWWPWPPPPRPENAWPRPLRKFARWSGTHSSRFSQWPAETSFFCMTVSWTVL